MSLWTPGGEHEVPREPTPSASPSAPDASAAQVDIDPEMAEALAQMSPEERAEAEAMIAQMAQARAELASTPADVVIANHAMGLYELAAIHLSQDPPHLPEANLAVDALAALLGGVEGRLGQNEATLRQALGQLQMAFVELSKRNEGTSGGSAGAAEGSEG